MLYGVDYYTHDIPTYLFSIGENYQTCDEFFRDLRLLNYPLQNLVCDDNKNIYQACSHTYPKVVTQLCLNHYKENLRRILQSRRQGNEYYAKFMYEITQLFAKKRSRVEFNTHATKSRYAVCSLVQQGNTSFDHADNWLNSYFLRRRLRPFTDCNKKFKELNGKISLQQT